MGTARGGSTGDRANPAGKGEGSLPAAGRVPGGRKAADTSRDGNRCGHTRFFSQEIVIIAWNAAILARNRSLCHFPRHLFIRLKA